MRVTDLTNFVVEADGTMRGVVSVMPETQNEKYLCVFIAAWLSYAQEQTPPLTPATVLNDIENVAKALNVPIPAIPATKVG